jgi:hypothetical protein
VGKEAYAKKTKKAKKDEEVSNIPTDSVGFSYLLSYKA